MMSVGVVVKVIFLALIFAIITYKSIQIIYHLYVNRLRPRLLFKGKPQILHPSSTYYHTNYIIHSNVVYNIDLLSSDRLSIIKQIYGSDRDISTKLSTISNILSSKERLHLHTITKQIYVVPVFSVSHLKKLRSKNIIKKSALTTHTDIAQKLKNKSDSDVYTPSYAKTIDSYIIKYSIYASDIKFAHRYYIIIDLSSTNLRTSNAIFAQIILEDILQILYHNSYISNS